MSEPVVTVKQGALRGAEIQGVLGKSFITFRGIPYAAPPVGDLRFRDPQPVKPWAGIRDALEDGSQCAQEDLITRELIGNDDCLYLNVATKSLTGSKPVMVWIHGGAFVMGDGGYGWYRPDYLMEFGDIVYVGINYRLGILGFLNLDDDVATGNMGLKDQVAALKWVKENIAQFGGDPNNVTIFGESAGGASIHYLLLSPLAKGLFHKGIVQSGVVANPWATVDENISHTHRLVSTLGKDTTDPKEIVEFLRTIPPLKLVETNQKLLTEDERYTIKFSYLPTIDKKSTQRFVNTDSIEEFINQGIDVPVMIGYTSHEGLLMLMGMTDEVYEKLDGNFGSAVPKDLARKAPSKVDEIARAIRKLYFGDKKINADQVDKYVEFYGDTFFVRGIHKVVQLHMKKKTPMYLYQVSFTSDKSFARALFKIDSDGAMHGEELQYLFYATKFKDLIKLEPNSTEMLVRRRFVRLWTDFAKTGNPTPIVDDLITVKWEPVNGSAEYYLDIDSELIVGKNLNEDKLQAWKRIEAVAKE